MVSKSKLTWIGPTEGHGAYPTINRHMIRELRALGLDLLPNVHNDGLAISPASMSCLYPPMVPTYRHHWMASWSTWEFGGPFGVPLSFAKAFDDFDLVLAMSEWVAEQYSKVTKTPVNVVPLGTDEHEFAEAGETVSWNSLLGTDLPAGCKVLLWVGGTDARHGFDVALKVIDLLPEEYHLVAKQSTDYPEHAAGGERVHVLRCDFRSLAPLYRSADLLLHTARAVGFSLPVLDALATGLQVVSTDLPPVREYAPADRVSFVPSKLVPMPDSHHVHKDCRPEWFVSDVDDFVTAILDLKPVEWNRDTWVKGWTWKAAAEKMYSILEEKSG